MQTLLTQAFAFLSARAQGSLFKSRANLVRSSHLFASSG